MKKELRLKILSCLKSQKKQLKQEADVWLTEELLKSSSYKEAQVIATYLSLEHEFDTGFFIERALQDGKRLCIPRTYAEGKMEFVEYDPKILRRTRFGLMEPGPEGITLSKSEINLIHVPGIVFNSQGYRIGYGGGYYDRYLADFNGDSVSTIYDFQRCEFQADIYDIAVKEILMYETNF